MNNTDLLAYSDKLYNEQKVTFVRQGEIMAIIEIL